MRKRVLALSAAVVLGACVPLPPSELPPDPGSAVTRAVFPGLDPGAKTVSSLHFETHAYGVDGAQKTSELAEQLYTKVMGDTGLYSFVPRGLYQLNVYSNAEEYLKKSAMPSWSGGVSAGNAIYSYDSPQLPGVLAHEMTHLIFFEYMGVSRAEHRWVNEGLAVYEEQEAARVQGRAPINFNAPIQRPLPFERMIQLAPLTEDQASAAAWYAQAVSVVRFMVERGGHVGMGQFLAALRDGRTADEAVKAGFPGVWDGMASLEAAWLRG
ncbi:MAG TPA: hypothetical protein VNI01_07590 [Elusimicrobiota bacterium]|nr:hypothetical protein [Elusimicrobiota bacterium]